MRLGHFHLHGSVVQRSQGSVTRGSAISSAAYQANESLTHEQQRVGEIDLSHRKQLNKGVITESLREELTQHGISLSDDATATKENRRNWTIADGDNIYRIKEFEQRQTDEETGKRRVTHRALDLYTDVTYDYTDKHDLVESWIQAPPSADWWVGLADEKKKQISPEERQRIWGKLEQVEVSRDAQIATKISMALPRDLSEQQNIALVQRYVEQQFTQNNLMVDVAIHRVTASDGKENLHAHLLIPIRPLDANGEFAKHKHDYANKGHYWQSKKRYIDWRKGWRDIQNAQFKELGLDVRVSHRRYKQDGIDRVPGVHLGPAADHMERRGTSTRRGQQNREIADINAQNPEQNWGYTEPIQLSDVEPGTFIPISQTDGDRQSEAQGQRARIPFSATLLPETQYPFHLQPHLQKMPFDPKLLGSMENYQQVAQMSMRNGRLTLVPQPAQVQKAVKAQTALNHPLKRHHHRPNQKTASWVNQVITATWIRTKQAVSKTRQAMKKVVGHWTNRVQARRQQPIQQRIQQTGVIEHER